MEKLFESSIIYLYLQTNVNLKNKSIINFNLNFIKMKKGLLSLLAVTLTMVGCQDYDDQFAELTGLVNGLSTEVAGLSTVNASVAALSTTVNGLSSAMAGNTTTITTALAAAQADIDAIEALLANVTTADELAAVSAALAAVQADVTTLLEADAVINQNVVINNSATLEYVNSLIGSAVDDPNVIVNGSVTINTTTFSPAITAAQLAEVNAIAGKLATVLGAGASTVGVAVTSATPITFTNLSFIDDDYTVSGADMDDAALRTVSGNLSASHGGAPVAFDYSQLASIGGNLVIAAADAATATSINLSDVVITGSFGEFGQTPGVLTFEGAITVDLGTSVFSSLTAAKATSITSLNPTFAALTISATNGGIIDINSATVATEVEITGTSTTVLHMNLLAGVTDLDINTVSEAHFPALRTFTAPSDIDASTAIALTNLATITTGATLNLNTAPTVILSALADVDAAVTWSPVSTPINWPNADLDGGTLSSTTATDVTIKSFDVIADVPASVTHLTLTGQNADLGATGAVTNLTVTADGAGIDVAAAGATLDHVSLSGTTLSTFAADTTGLISIALNDTATNTIIAGSTVATLSLTGTLLSIDSAAVTLAEFNNTSTFKDIPGTVTGETPISIKIINTTLLTSVDLSSMEKVANVTFTGNTGLTSLIAPTGATNLLTPGGSPTFTITGNSIVATYTSSTASFSGDGINPATPYAAACIHSPSLATWKDYIMAISAVDTVTYVIDAKFGTTVDGYGEALVADTTNTHHDSGDAGAGANADTINNAEVGLALVSATACD